MRVRVEQEYLIWQHVHRDDQIANEKIYHEQIADVVQRGYLTRLGPHRLIVAVTAVLRARRATSRRVFAKHFAQEFLVIAHDEHERDQIYGQREHHERNVHGQEDVLGDVRAYLVLLHGLLDLALVRESDASAQTRRIEHALVRRVLHSVGMVRLESGGQFGCYARFSHAQVPSRA